jgi:hypothetical protein
MIPHWLEKDTGLQESDSVLVCLFALLALGVVNASTPFTTFCLQFLRQQQF